MVSNINDYVKALKAIGTILSVLKVAAVPDKDRKGLEESLAWLVGEIESFEVGDEECPTLIKKTY